MPASLRLAYIPIAVAIAVAAVVSAVVVSANRPAVILGTPSASTSSSTVEGVLATGDATVSKKPDIAFVSAGVESQQATAVAAQTDLANKASKLISRIKSLGVPDKEITTSGYWLGPVYGPTGQSVSGYRGSEQLRFKWHNVDSVGKALDAVVQEGDATNAGVGFGLADPKSAQAEARSAAIADAKSKAQAMAGAAGVKLGPVVRVTDLSSFSRAPMQLNFGAADAKGATQVPVGELEVQVSVEVDFAIA
jgi:uncharacterized protein YggE